MKTMAMKVAAGFGLVAGAFALMNGMPARAVAGTVPDLGFGAGSVSNVGLGATVYNLGSFGMLITGSYTAGGTPYNSAFAGTYSGTQFVYDYAFDLTSPGLLTANVKGYGLTLAPNNAAGVPGGSGTMSLITGSVPIALGGGSGITTKNVELFQQTGSGWTLVTGGTGAVGAGGLETLTYAGLHTGDYIFAVVGANTTPFSGGSVAGNISISAVPLPGALLLFGAGLAALGVTGRKRLRHG